MIPRDLSGWHWRHDNPVAQAGVIDRLSACVTPTLVLSGELDVLGGYPPNRLQGGAATRISGATLLTFPDAGHVINEEDPAGFSAAVLEFVRRVAVPVST